MFQLGELVVYGSTGVCRVEEDNVSDARELLGLALTLVFSYLRCIIPELDLQHIVETVHVES